jgi:lincosamide and streptogramin A transport system ATP-binding/permease protein
MRELNLLEVPEDALNRPFSTLSNGEQTKVLLAALFLRENCFPLIDEPTNHLDMRARELAAKYLKSKKGFILVSHDRGFLDDCVDHILSINRADIEVQKGNFSSWWRGRQLRDSFELEENERLKGDIKRLQAAARQASAWSDRLEKTKKGTRNSGLRPDTGYIGHKSAKMMKRSKNLEGRRNEAAEEKSALLKNIESAESLKLRPLTHHADCLVEASDLSVSYDGRVVFSNLSFELMRGEALALRGANGTGKSTILKLICGEEIAHTGQIRTAGGLVISYVPQDASDIGGSLYDYAEGYGIDESLFLAILRKLGFERTQFEKDISDFSAGQKKKVAIARSLCQSAHLYVWDEPLNYIDVISRMQIEELLKEFKPTILFIEHDRSFTDAIATKIVNLDTDK